MNRQRKIFFLLSIMAVGIVICISVIALISSRLLEKEAVKGKIISGISQKIGGKVSFHNVSVAILPRPCIVVHQPQFTIAEDIKGTVESLRIYPEILPLLSGKIRIARISVQSPVFSLGLTEKKESHASEDVQGKTLSILNDIASAAPDLIVSIKNGSIIATKNNREVLSLENTDARASLMPDRLTLKINSVSNFSQKISLTMHFQKNYSSISDITLSVEGRDINVQSARETAFLLAGDAPVVRNIFSYIEGGSIPYLSFQSRGESVTALGKTDNISIKGRLQDGDLFIPDNRLTFRAVKGEFVVRNGILEGRNIESTLGNAVLRKGELKVGLKESDAPFHLDIYTRINIAESMQLLNRFIKDKPFPLNALKENEGNIEGNLILGESTDVFSRWGAKGNLLFKGTINIINGPAISLELTDSPGEFRIRDLVISDEKSRASISVNLKEKVMGLTFNGNLFRSTLDKLFTLPYLQGGFIQGNFRTEIDTGKPSLFNADGNLSADRILIPWKKNLPISIETLRLNGKKNRLQIDSAILHIADTSFSARGALHPSPQSIVTDLDIKAEKVKWETLRDLFKAEGKGKPGGKQGRYTLPFTGRLRMKADSFIYSGIPVSPLDADFSLSPDKIIITVTRASVCGISTPGIAEISSGLITMSFSPKSTGRELKPAVSCITGQKSIITGSFDLRGSLKAKGESGRLLQSLNGKIDFAAKNGRVYKSATLAKVFSIVNVTGIFQGSIPDLFREGFAYNSFNITGDVKNGKVLLKEILMDAPSMKIAGTGRIDLLKEQVDIQLLVAPLKSADSLLDKIPFIKHITGPSLVSFPIRVHGDLNNPEVNTLAVPRVGTGLIGIMERMLTLSGLI
jgi:hypothetical protein